MKRILLPFAVLVLMAFSLLVGMPHKVLAATSSDSNQQTNSQTAQNSESTATTKIQENLCSGANLSINSGCNQGGLTDDEVDKKVDKVVKTVVDIFTFVVGVTSVIMIIIGGFKYVTSGGDSGNVTGAKNTIMYAIIGLVVVALAQVIVRFVLKKASEI